LLKLHKEYLNAVTHDISLTLDEELNSLMYEMFFYVTIYRIYKLLKTVWFFWPTMHN